MWDHISPVRLLDMAATDLPARLHVREELASPASVESMISGFDGVPITSKMWQGEPRVIGEFHNVVMAQRMATAVRPYVRNVMVESTSTGRVLIMITLKG